MCDWQNGNGKMDNKVFTIQDIASLIKPIAEQYGVKAIYLFGSYIFALSEELREVLKKDVDVFEINEINKDSDFYNAIMKERVLVA